MEFRAAELEGLSPALGASLFVVGHRLTRHAARSETVPAAAVTTTRRRVRRARMDHKRRDRGRAQG